MGKNSADGVEGGESSGGVRVLMKVNGDEGDDNVLVRLLALSAVLLLLLLTLLLLLQLLLLLLLPAWVSAVAVAAVAAATSVGVGVALGGDPEPSPVCVSRGLGRIELLVETIPGTSDKSFPCPVKTFSCPVTTFFFLSILFT